MDTIPSPVGSIDRKHFPQKPLLVLLVATIVLAAGTISVAAYKGYIHLSISSNSNAERQLSAATIIAYFPNLSDIRGVEPDPTNSHLFWLFNHAGVIMQINVETQEVTDYSQKIHETDLTSLVRVGDTLFIGLQGGGILQYNLDTRVTKRYTEDNGLVSNDNIFITPDPSDADVLWIGTFYGLNKLTISSGKIDTFQSEMGITSTQPRTSIQPIVFHVDSQYVWVIINANAFTAGGVARLDKKTGIWKSWGYENFGESALKKSRFDSYGAAADGERAVVEESRNIYRYNPTQDTWVLVIASQQSEPVKTNISLKGNLAYYVAGIPKELNIDTGVERDLLDSGNVFEKILPNIHMNLEQLQNQMILYPSTSKRGSSNDVIGILPLDGSNKMSTFSFAVLDTKFGLTNVSLADVSNEQVLLNASDRLVEYDVTKSSARNLLPYLVNIAKIVGNKVVALNLATCDMYCSLADLTATSTIISLDTGVIDFSATLNGVQTPTYHIGNSLNEIYLFENKYSSAGNEYRGYKLNATKKSLEDVGTAFPLEFVPNEFSKYSGKNTNGSYTISFDPKDKDAKAIFRVQHGSATTTEIIVPFVPVPRTSPFGPYDQSVQFANYSFDSLQPSIVWIGTDHGLIRLDMSTLTYRLYTTGDGLLSNKITRVAVTDADVVVEHPGGVYIYQFSNL